MLPKNEPRTSPSSATTSRTVHVRVPNEVDDKLTALAQKARRSKSSYVAILLENHVAKESK